MSLTVAAALDLEIFQRAGARVVVGRDALDRLVRWVHVGEIPDIAQFLVGGELLLTAGLGISHTEKDQRVYIRSLAEAGAAALVVELAGRAFAVLPQAVIDEAKCCGLPVVTLEREIRFVEATRQVHERILDLRVQELQEEAAINEAFTKLLLDGADHVAIVSEMASRLSLPVVLENGARQVVCYAGHRDAADSAVIEWAAHSRLGHDTNPTGRLDTTVRAPGMTCSRQSVVLRRECWGYLHVMHSAQSLPRKGVYALQHAAAAVAISLLWERASSARHGLREAALLHRLYLEDVSGEQFVAGALSLGQDLRDRPLIVIAAARNRPDGERAIRDCLSAAGYPALIGDVCEHPVAVVALPSVSDADLVERIRRSGLTAGLSNVVDLAHLNAALRQARQALIAGGCDPTSPVWRYQDLGMMRLLVSLAEGPDLARYVEDELRPLLAHDAANNNPLLPTLRAFLDWDGRKAETAAHLHVQRRTLYYRLERINKLLGCTVEAPEVRHRLLLAVRGLALLNSASSR